MTTAQTSDAGSTKSERRKSWEGQRDPPPRDASNNSVYSVLRFMRSQEDHRKIHIKASFTPAFLNDEPESTSSRGGGPSTPPSGSQKSVSEMSIFSSSRRRRLGRLWFANAFRDSDLEKETATVGFVKRSTGIFSLAWITDTMTNQELKDPGRGWRPFKAVLMGETLYFYKVPSSLVPEVRRTFQIRSTQWPTTFHASDDTNVPAQDKEGEPVSQSEQAKNSNTAGTTSDQQERIAWRNPGKHPELVLISEDVGFNAWAAHIDYGTPAALAHEIVFGTQQPSGSPEAREGDAKTFLHMVYFSLNSTYVPWYTFLRAVREYLVIGMPALVVTHRVALFVDLLLWKRPLLHQGHEERVFGELEYLITELAQVETVDPAPMREQMSEWREQVKKEDLCVPTDWLAEPRMMSFPGRSDLAALEQCWNSAVFVQQDPCEIAKQIQSFHIDRLTAFLRVPVSAYRLSSSVTEPLLRSFRFDATRPHWLTHVIMRQLLVNEAPENQGEAAKLERVTVLQHWIHVATHLLRYGDMAGWVAVCSALCSRAAASLDMLWRSLPLPSRDLVTMQWAPKLASYGWIEGVQASVEPVLEIETNGCAAPTPSSVPYFGNAGMLNVSLSDRAANGRVEVRIASQEAEFSRIRALALKLNLMYGQGKTPVGPAPIAEYQALFQRLSTYEFVLQTSVTDYMGSAVIADGCMIENRQPDAPSDWPTTTLSDAEGFFTFPTPFPAILPTFTVAQSIMSRRDLMRCNVPDRAFASFGRCAARAAAEVEEVQMGEDLILYPMHPRLVGAQNITAAVLASERWASRVFPPPEGRFSVEVRAASSTRLVDLLVLSTDFLVVRAPVDPPTIPPTYQPLGVELDLDAFRDTCLLSYRGWISASDFLDALMLRWHAAESACKELEFYLNAKMPNHFPSWKRTPDEEYAYEPVDITQVTLIRLRVLETLHRWLDLYPREWIANLVLFETLYKFLRDILNECMSSPAGPSVLVEYVRKLLNMFPTLTTRAIAAMGFDCFANVPTAVCVQGRRTFDWSLSAADFVTYIESVVSLPFSLLSAHDLALTSILFEQFHTSQQTWLEAATNDSDTCLSIYTLLRSLPPGRLCARAPSGASLWDMLPPSVQELCKIHEVIRDWTQAQVSEPHIGIESRVARMNKLIDAVLLSRASMTHRMRRGSPQDQGVRAPLPLTFLESAVLEGLTSKHSLAHRAAWNRLATERNVRAWADLLGSAPTTLPDDLPVCTPDIGWNITVFAHWGARAKARASVVPLLAFSRYMSTMDLINDVIKLQQKCVPLDTCLGLTRLRLVWLRNSTVRATWPHNTVLDDAAAEAKLERFPMSAPIVFYAGLEIASDQKRRDTKSLLLKVSGLPDASTEEMEDLFESQEDLTLPAASTFDVSQDAHPNDSLLRAVPTARVSSSFRCTDALLTVWPYNKHPFVLQLSAPNGRKCVLKMPNYNEFSRWLSSLQSLANVRMAETFDAGTYAAQVAEYLGRASASCVFGVPLRELSARTGGLALPLAIERVLQEIESRGLHEQGIYRISGTQNVIEALEQQLDTRPVDEIALAEVDVHVLTSVFKMWLRKLPEPVVPYEFYDALIRSERNPHHNERVRAMRKIIGSFPQCHYLAFNRITLHLKLVARSSKINLMAGHNIGLVFGSTLLGPPSGTGSVARGLENLGRAAHIVKIAVLMHDAIFTECKT